MTLSVIQASLDTLLSATADFFKIQGGARNYRPVPCRSYGACSILSVLFYRQVASTELLRPARYAAMRSPHSTPAFSFACGVRADCDRLYEPVSWRPLRQLCVLARKRKMISRQEAKERKAREADSGIGFTVSQYALQQVALSSLLFSQSSYFVLLGTEHPRPEFAR